MHTTKNKGSERTLISKILPVKCDIQVDQRLESVLLMPLLFLAFELIASLLTFTLTQGLSIRLHEFCQKTTFILSKPTLRTCCEGRNSALNVQWAARPTQSISGAFLTGRIWIWLWPSTATNLFGSSKAALLCSSPTRLSPRHHTALSGTTRSPIRQSRADGANRDTKGTGCGMETRRMRFDAIAARTISSMPRSRSPRPVAWVGGWDAGEVGRLKQEKAIASFLCKEKQVGWEVAVETVGGSIGKGSCDCVHV